MAGRGQGERECQAEGGRPLHSPTMPTTRTTALHVAGLRFARRASPLASLLMPSLHAWLLAAQSVVYEHCGQREIKEHFDSFCEDYNTATMPSKKYYDIQAWHAAEQAKGRKKKVRHAKGG